MKKYFMGGILGIVSIILFLTYYMDKYEEKSDKRIIKIGFFGPLSGSYMVEGKAAFEGMQMAADEQNANEGIGGKRIEIVAYDDRGMPTEAVKAVNELLKEEHVRAIYGSTISVNMKATGEMIEKSQTLCLSGASSSAWEKPGWRYLFRCAANSTLATKSLVRYAVSQGISEIAVFASDDLYGITAVKEFEDAALASGIQIKAAVSMSNGNRDFSRQIEAISHANPQAVFVWCHGEDLEAVTKQLRYKGINCPILGGEGYTLLSVKKNTGSALEGVVFPAQYLIQEDPNMAEEERMRHFLTKFIARYGRAPESDHAFRAYDGTKLLFNAMQRYQGNSRSKLRSAFVEQPAFTGLAGTFHYREKQNEAIDSVMLYRIDKGEFKKVNIEENENEKVDHTTVYGITS